jgi:hypothetical protein
MIDDFISYDDELEAGRSADHQDGVDQPIRHSEAEAFGSARPPSMA